MSRRICFSFLALVLLWLAAAPSVFAQSLITQSNVTSLKRVWQTSVGSAIVATPIVFNVSTSVESVFVGGENGIFYSINAGTGAILWTFQTGGPITQPAIPASLSAYVGSVDFESADGCVYALNAASGALGWKQCQPASSTQFVGLASSDTEIVVAYNHNNTSGVIQAFDETSGALQWTYSSAEPFSGLTAGYDGQSVIVAATTGQLLVLSPYGSLVGSAALPGPSVGAPLVITSGIVQDGGDPCPSSDNTNYYAVVAVGATVYVSRLSSSGPGSFESVTLTSNVASGPALFLEVWYSSVTHRDPSTGLLYTCFNQYTADDIFYPLASGAMSAVYVSDIGQEAANGSENVGASPEPLYFLGDQSNPFGSTGMVFAASGTHLLAVLIPQGTVDNIFTGYGNLGGTVSDGYSPNRPMRLYFADSGGYIYALSATGT